MSKKYDGQDQRDSRYNFDDGYSAYSNESRYEYGDGYSDCSQISQRVRRNKYYDSDSDRDIFSSSEREAEYRRQYRTRDRIKGKSTLIGIVSLILVILIIFGGAVVYFAYSIIKPIDYQEFEDFSFEAYLQNDFNTLSSDELYSQSYVQNIMLFGIDEDTSEYGRSDTMMLLSIDKKHKTLKLTSFQRDTFIHCPDPDGDYRTKLNYAFSYGGIPLAINTIETNFGIEIDRYATVNFDTFKSIVDILGGVEIELTEREILYINCQIAQNNQTEYLDAQEGVVLLNGQQALWYARNRGGDVINGVDFTEGTDWDRTQRQRKFLEAVVDSLKEASVFELYSIIRSIVPNITTNLTEFELTALALKAPIYLTYDMKECSMPAEDTWYYDYNFAGDIIYVYDWDKTRETLRNFVFED